MHKITLFLAVLAASVIFCGCASVKVTEASELSNQKLVPGETTVAHLNAENWGFYFFMFPLISGSTAEPGKIVFLEDTVTTQNVVSMLTNKAKEMKGAKTVNIVSRHNPMPFWLGVREVQVSANVVK